jgi:cerevisin
MRFTSTILTALIAIIPFSSVTAAPSPMHEVQRFSGTSRPGSFIVTLKSDVDKSAWLSKRPYVNTSWDFDSEFMNGFSSKLDEETLQQLRADPTIESIAEDGVMRTMALVTQ